MTETLSSSEPFGALGASPDAALLERFVREGASDAFRELSTRYAALVHGTCRRVLGREDLAEDAAQETFVLLARKAPRLLGHPSIAGWLYTAARNVARTHRRQERRRTETERQALIDVAAPPGSDFALDDGLARQKPAERELIVLRFLHGESLAEVGARLGISEDAARMRVNRAVDLLRGRLAQAGMAMPLEGLVHALLQTPPALPPRVARGLATKALGAQPAPSALAVSLGKPVAWAGVAVAIGVGGGVFATRPRPKPVARAAAEPTPLPPSFPTRDIRSIPLRLEPDALAKTVWGRVGFERPFQTGMTALRVGRRDYAVRRTASGLDVDRDGDGRLEPEERLSATSSPMKNDDGVWFATQLVETTLRPPGGKALPIGFRLVPNAAPTFPRWLGKIMVGPNFAYVGRTALAGRRRLVAVTSVGPGVEYLSVDRDGNGRAGDPLTEQYRMDRPFNLGGTTYRARLVFQKGGSSLQIAPSKERVAQVPLYGPIR